MTKSEAHRPFPKNNKQQDPVKTPKYPNISVVDRSKNLAAALQTHVMALFPGSVATIVEKMTDVPAGNAVATLGTPTFVPNNLQLDLLVVGTRQCAQDEKKDQWNVIRNAESSVEDIRAELGLIDEVVMIGNRRIGKIRMELSDYRLAIAEAATDEERLATYKAAFDFLLAAGPYAPRKAAVAETTQQPAEATPETVF